MTKKKTLGSKMIRDVKGIVAKIGGAGKTKSRAVSERIVPVPQVDTYSELPFAPVKKADFPNSRRSAPAAKAKPKAGSSEPSKPRARKTSKSPKKRTAAK